MCDGAHLWINGRVYCLRTGELVVVGKVTDDEAADALSGCLSALEVLK